MDQEMSLNEKIALGILSKLPIDSEEDRIRYLKCKFGIQSILVDIVKSVIIYGTAIIFNMLIPVLLFQLGYVLIRHFGYGAHSPSNAVCTIMSIVTFLGIPLLVQNYILLDKIVLIILIMINFFIIYANAPSSTDKNPIVDVEKREKYKNRTLLGNFIILIIVIFNKDLLINNYIVLGSVLACIYMLPISHRVLKSRKIGGEKDEIK